MKLPLVADIKRHSLEDGPGIRSVVFFKGCPLRCVFCHNPEMQRPERELVFRSERCVRCGTCVAACPLGAISLDRLGRIDRVRSQPASPAAEHRGRVWEHSEGSHLDRPRCDDCGKCVLACPSSALAYVGRAYTVEALTEVLLRDQAYYRQSGGGVTLSGGECTMFPDYVEGLARSLKQQGIHLLVETAGVFDGAWFVERLLPLLDLVYFDVKLAEANDHRLHTGGDNHRICENLALLLRQVPERVEIRIPLVPGITATHDNLTALGKRLRGLGVRRATLLPYNPLGREMAARLGREIPHIPERFMTKEELATAIAVFEAAVL
jgi:pyruvate formate lyase activating enzyme